MEPTKEQRIKSFIDAGVAFDPATGSINLDKSKNKIYSKLQATQEGLLGTPTGAFRSVAEAEAALRAGTTPPGTPAPGSFKAAAEKFYGGLDTEAPDEEEIRAESVRQIQAQLDAINEVYASMLTRERRRGEERAGQGRAISARSGLLGSDFGEQRRGQIEELNKEKEEEIKVRQAASVTAILDKANTRADVLIEAEKNRAFKNEEAVLTFKKQQQDEARTDVANFFKTGRTFADLPKDAYQKLLDQSGYTPEQMLAVATLNKPDEQVLTSFVQGNKYYVVTQDPVTKQRKTETVQLPFEVPGGYKEQKIGDNTLIFYPTDAAGNLKIPAGKTLKDVLLTYEAAPNAGQKLDIAKKQLEIQKLQKEIDATGKFSIPKPAINNLLKYGFTGEMVTQLENDIRTYGLAKAMEGLDDKTQTLIQTELDKQYIVTP